MEKVNIKKVVLVLATVFVIATIGICATACSDSNEESNTGNEGIVKEETVNEDPENEEPDVVTDTPYCKLNFPGEWKDDVVIENSQEEPYTVDYYGVVNDEKYFLFSLVFGESDGFCLGTFTTEDGPVDMHIVEGELDNIEDLSDKEQKMLFDMQINVNHIIQELENDKNFKIS